MAQSDFLGGGARWKSRKKKKKRETVSDERGQQNSKTRNPLLQDPFEVLGSDLLLAILSYLDARSVALSLPVSRSWYAVASSDRLWSSKCMELWLGKAHIPRLAQSRGLPKLAAYSLSVMDGKRTRIMREDLCDHAWQFLFNKYTGEILIRIGKEATLSCAVISIPMVPKLQILMIEYGVAMKAAFLPLQVLLVMGRSENTMLE